MIKKLSGKGLSACKDSLLARKGLSLVILGTLVLASCTSKRYEAKKVKHDPPVNTESKEIAYQEKMAYSFNEGTISFDNNFDAARLNDCQQVNDSTFTVLITPENQPINFSPWYAFRIVSAKRQDIYINIEYKGSRHRYRPKVSFDCINWDLIPEDNVAFYPDTMGITIRHTLSSDTSWISAQEIENSRKVMNYWSTRTEDSSTELITIGETPLGRPLIMLDLSDGDKKGVPVVAILGRQHPPEITGYYAMKAFVNRILEEDDLARNFRQTYRVLVFPLVNPDGVDLGHWRHNSGGIDLNRDWGAYNQPEVRIISDRIVFESISNRSDLILGMDFHSTGKDVYYTNKLAAADQKPGGFKEEWLKAMDEIIPGEAENEEPTNIYPSLISKNWFYNQFKTEAIIYEVGDTMPRDFIEYKAKVAAEVMMKILNQ